MKKSSREKLNLFFSAFLVIGFIVCSYFFMTLSSRMPSSADLITLGVCVVFGLVLFYATRVGEGIPVKRFSPIILLVLDLPALFIIIATLAPNFPLHDVLVEVKEVMMFACIALGYGVPYTFLSGFEIAQEVDEVEAVVEGGLAQELLELDETEDATDDQVATEEDVEELKALDGEDTQAEE